MVTAHEVIWEMSVECEAAKELASQIRQTAGFEKQDGLFQFCEGRLYDKEYYQLFSWTTWLKDGQLDSSTISLFMMRNLAASAQLEAPLFAMILQSMLYANKRNRSEPEAGID